MVEKLPVKLFEKREQDVQRTEGGGGNPPAWILSNGELKEKAKFIYDSFQEIEDVITKEKSKQPNFVPYTIEVDIIDDAKAKSHKKIVNNFFDINELTGEIGMRGDKSILIKIDSLESFKELQQKTLEIERYKYSLSAIENVSIYEPNIGIGSVESNYKLKLFNYHHYETNRVVNQYLKEQLTQFNIDFKEIAYTDDLIVFKLTNLTLDQIDIVKELPVYSFTQMPKYTINQTAEISTLSELKKIEFDESIKYPIVGVLDSGIELNEFNEEWIIDREAFYIDDDIDTTHGTFVSGVILYGDELEGKIYTGVNGCKVLDVPVVSTDTDEDELLNNIRRAISKHSEIKIWNLSVSLIQEIKEDTFSDIAIALDKIQDEFDVIICKSAGNSKAFISGYPKEKIHAPGDSIRAVVVGSIAQESDNVGFSRKDYPSPYTRIGRGPARVVKPDVVHYGGDVLKNEKGELVYKGVPSLNVDGTVRSDCGTSFSTPRIAAILAGLQSEMNESFDALLLKALLIHSADYGECDELDAQTKLDQLGYGKPKSVNEILYGNTHEITLILRDTLQKGKFVDIMDFPFPSNLVSDGFFEGQVTVTLVYNSYLESSQGSEYCQSDINVKFGTYDEKVDRDIEKASILNPIGRDKSSQNILLSKLYSKRVNKSKDYSFAKERMLIDFGAKFYPVKKYNVDLSELTPTNKENLLIGNRKWFLKIEGLYRDFIEKKAVQSELDLSMDYCIVITIKDPKQERDVYSSVIQELDSNNFIHQDISLNNYIRVENDGQE